MSRARWYREEEIAYIRKNYEMMTVRELAEHLDRNETALRQKMWELKIHKHDTGAKPKAPRPQVRLLDPDYEWVCCHGEWRVKRKKPKPQKDDGRLIRFPRNWLLSNPGWRA